MDSHYAWVSSVWKRQPQPRGTVDGRRWDRARRRLRERSGSGSPWLLLGTSCRFFSASCSGTSTMETRRRTGNVAEHVPHAVDGLAPRVARFIAPIEGRVPKLVDDRFVVIMVGMIDGQISPKTLIPSYSSLSVRCQCFFAIRLVRGIHPPSASNFSSRHSTRIYLIYSVNIVLERVHIL